MRRFPVFLYLLLALLFLGVFSPIRVIAGQWANMPGAALDIGAGGDGSVWIVGTDNNVYRLNAQKNGWEQMPGNSVTRIDVDSDGNPWAVNAGGDIFRWDPPHTVMAFPESPRENPSDDIGYWLRKQGETGTFGGIAPNSRRMFLPGALVAEKKLIPGSWKQVPGKAKDIGCGNDGSVFIVDMSNNVAGWNPDTNAWEPKPLAAGAESIDVAGEGSPIVTNAKNEIWFWTQATKGWVKINGEAQDITAGLVEIVVNGHGTPYQWMGLDADWSKLDGEIKRISLGMDDTLWAVWKDNTIRRRTIDPSLLTKFMIDPALGAPPVYSKTGLKCGYIKDFNQVWTSTGIGALKDVAVYRPKVPNGWAFVGDSIGFGGKTPEYSVLVIEDDPNSDNLKKPVDYEQVWSDRIYHSKPIPKTCQHASIWRPIPPPGYVAMGTVVTRDYQDPKQDPGLAALRCVKREHVQLGRASQPVWNDSGSGAAPPVSFFVAKRDTGDDASLPPGTFLVGRYNSNPAGGDGGGSGIDLAADSDGYLIGFEGECGRYIGHLKPIYRRYSDPKKEYYGTGRGEGRDKGNGHDARFEVRAKPGYAVGGVKVRAGGALDAFNLVFFKVSPDEYRSNPDDKYESGWYGGGGGNESQLGGWGCFFQGINMTYGWWVDSLGLVPSPMVQPWLIKGLTPQDYYDAALNFMEAYLNNQNLPKWKRQAFNELLNSPELAGLKNPKPVPARADPAFELPKSTDVKNIKAGGTAKPSLQAIGNASQELSKGTSDDFLKELAKIPGLSEKLKTLLLDGLKKIGITEPAFEKLEGDTFSFKANMGFKVTPNQVVPVAVHILVDIPSENISLSAHLPYELKNAMGVQGLTIKNLSLEGSLLALFVAGELDVGAQAPLKLTGAYSPLVGLGGLTAEIGLVSLSDILKLVDLMKGNKVSEPAVPTTFIRLANAKLTIAQITDPTMGWEENKVKVDGILDMGFEKGPDLIKELGLQNSLHNLGTITAYISPTGVGASGKIRPIRIGPLEITGSNAGSSEGPAFDLVLEVDPSGTTWRRSDCTITARAQFTPWLVGDVLLKLNGDTIDVRVNARAFALDVLVTGNTKITEKLNLGDINANVKIRNSFIVLLQEEVQKNVKIPFFARAFTVVTENLFRIIDVNTTDAKLDRIFRGFIPAMEITLNILGAPAGPIPVPETHVDQWKDGSVFTKPVTEIGNLIKEKLEKLGSDIAKKAQEYATVAYSKTRDGAIQAANGIKSIAEVSAKEITNVANSIGNFTVTAAKDFGNAITENVRKIGNFFSNVFNKLKFW